MVVGDVVGARLEDNHPATGREDSAQPKDLVVGNLVRMTRIPSTGLSVARFTNAQPTRPDVAHQIARHSPPLSSPAQLQRIATKVGEGAVLNDAIRRMGSPESAPDRNRRLRRLEAFAGNAVIGLGEGDSRERHALNLAS